MPSWVQIMACCLIGAKPLSETMLTYRRLNLKNKFQQNLNHNTIIIMHEYVFTKMSSAPLSYQTPLFSGCFGWLMTTFISSRSWCWRRLNSHLSVWYTLLYLAMFGTTSVFGGFQVPATLMKLPPITTNPEEFLSCGICAEPYDDDIHQGKFLSCHHTFCSHCLNKLMNDAPPGVQIAIQCPNCRSHTDVEYRQIDKLQTNFYIAHVQEIFKSTVPRETAANLLGCHGHNDQPICDFCVTCGKYFCCDCSVMKHTAKKEHSVISITEPETSYLQELNLSHQSVMKINKNLQLVESEIALLTAAKDTAIKDMETMIKQVYEQHRNVLMKNILDQFNAQHDALLDRQKQMQEVNEFLNETVTQAENIIETGILKNLRTISECLREMEESVQSVCTSLDLGKNHLAFDSNEGMEEFNNCLDKLGRIYFKGFLPSAVAFRSTEATAGHKATLTVEICNHRGDKIPISPGSVSVQVTDPTGKEVQTALSTSGPECIVTFTPQMSGLHKVSGIFLGQQLTRKQTCIPVSGTDLS